MKPTPHLAFWLSLLCALLLQLIPLPSMLDLARPMWPPLMLGYWAMAEPRVPSVFAAFACGLLMDVLFNTPLGQHALGLVLVTYVIVRLRSLFGLFPQWQAVVALAPVWSLYAFIMFWLDGIGRHQSDPLLRWQPVLTTSLFWPLSYSLLQWLIHRRRKDDNSL